MKKVLLFLVLVASAVTVNASELYWFVNDSTTESGETATYALLKAYDGTTSTSTTLQTISVENLSVVGYEHVSIDGYDSASCSFYVELQNSAKDLSYTLDETKMTDYSLLSTAGAISSTVMAQATPYGFDAVNAIPEPTSGLLMLLGIGALALRRKQVKVVEG